MCDVMLVDLNKRYPHYGLDEKIFSYAHLLHPGQKGTVANNIGVYKTLLQNFVQDEEGTPESVGLDAAIIDPDEDMVKITQMLTQNAAAMDVPVIATNVSPMEQELLHYRSAGLLKGKDLDVLAFWKLNEKTYPLLAKVYNPIQYLRRLIL